MVTVAPVVSVTPVVVSSTTAISAVPIASVVVVWFPEVGFRWFAWRSVVRFDGWSRLLYCSRFFDRLHDIWLE